MNRSGREDRSPEIEAGKATARRRRPFRRALDRPQPPSLTVELLQVATLVAFAVTQPLLELLGRKPEFFAIRRSEPVDIALLLAFLVFMMPTPLMALDAAARALHVGVQRHLHRVICGVLIAAIVLPPVNRSWQGSPWSMILVAVTIGGISALALERLAWVRTLVLYLTPSILIFPAVFLLRPGVGTVLFPEPVSIESSTTLPSAVQTPIVMMIFDELPASSLLLAAEQIDEARFPHFAALASQSTWYPQTAAVSDYTVLGVPAILTGRLPTEQRRLLPMAADYPHSLFTLLGPKYAMNVSESVTQLCPPTFRRREGPQETANERLSSLARDLWQLLSRMMTPREWARDLPPVDQGWMLFEDHDDWFSDWERRGRGDRVQQLESFLDGIESTDSPVVHLLHSVLPHPPFEYLPSGQLYSRSTHVVGLEGDIMAADSWAAVQIQQRHLLQLGFVDRLLGEVVSALRTADLWDRAIVVVTADHGASFRPRDHRRRITEANASEILAVPLFIKAPGQKVGRVDRRPTSTIDILPTVAELAGFDVPWSIDGTSRKGPEGSGREVATVVANRDPLEPPFHVDFEAIAVGQEAALALLDQRFEIGEDGGREHFRIGPYRHLIGRRLTDVSVTAPSADRFRLLMPSHALIVDPEGGAVPAHLRGEILDRSDQTPIELAIAVNGRIAATTTTWRFRPDRWSAIVDPSSFESGLNTVDVLAIEAQGDRVRLRKLTSEQWLPFSGLDEAGLHGVEHWRAGPIRWTDGEARFTIPIQPSFPPKKLRLSVAAVPPGGSEILVEVNDVTIVEARVELIDQDQWTTEVDLEGIDLGSSLDVLVVSDSFVPSRRNPDSVDTRRLGIAISGFELLDFQPIGRRDQKDGSP